MKISFQFTLSFNSIWKALKNSASLVYFKLSQVMLQFLLSKVKLGHAWLVWVRLSNSSFLTFLKDK
jgi:hypothetical protein